MGERVSEKQFLVNLYRGPVGYSDSRNIAALQFYLKDFSVEGKKANFDLILHHHLERSKAVGNGQLVLLDIGSGTQCAMIKDLLNTTAPIEKSRQFLSDNPDFKIIALGLTDSPTMSQQGQETPPSLGKDLKNDQIQIKNVFWTLSSTQTLSMFLGNQGINQIDLAFATESFQYFSPLVFKEVLETVSNKLSSGGQLFSSQCYGHHFPNSFPTSPGFLPYFQGFTSQSSPHSEKPWQTLIKLSANHQNYTCLDSLETKEIREGLQKAINIYIRLGALSPKKVKEIIKSNQQYIKPDDTVKVKIQKNTISILGTGYRHLCGQKAHQEELKKNKTLKDLPDVHLEILGSRFVMTKK